MAFLTFALLTLVLSISSPFYNLAFNKALFENKSNFYKFDILTKVLLIGFVVGFGNFLSGVEAFISIIVFYQIVQSLVPFVLTLGKVKN